MCDDCIDRLEKEVGTLSKELEAYKANEVLLLRKIQELEEEVDAHRSRVYYTFSKDDEDDLLDGDPT